jgi:HK97 family phage portal protein
MLRELIAAAVGAALGIDTKAADIRFQTEFLRAPIMDISFANIVREGYRKNSAVYSCVRVHATSFPEPPLVVKQKTGKGLDVVEEHPLTRLMRRPNPFMGQAEFWAMVVTWMAVGGNCYVWKRRDQAGRTMELWPLHDGLIRPVFHPTQWITGYQADAGDGRRVPVPIDEIIHLRWAPDPLQPQVGLTPIMAVAREVDTDNEAARYIHALLKNDAVPRTLVTVKNGLTDGAFKRLKQQFREQYGGSKRGDVMVLEGQEMSIDRLGLNLNELADAALRRVPETRIAGAFETPAILAGLGAGLDSATYSNAEALTEFFTETTLIPRWRSVAGQFQAQLLPDFGAVDPSLVVEFDLSEVRALADDEDAKWTRWRGAWTDGLATKNEARVALGMEPTEYGDVFLINNQQVPASHDPQADLDAAEQDRQARNRAAERPVVPAAGGDGHGLDDGSNPRALSPAPAPEAPSRNALPPAEQKTEAVPDRLAEAHTKGIEMIGGLLAEAVAEGLENLAAVVAGRIAEGKSDPAELLEAGDRDELIAVIADGHLAAYNQAGLDVRGILGGDVTPLSTADVDLSELKAELEATTSSAVAKTIAELVEAAEAATPATKALDWSNVAAQMLDRLAGLWQGRAKAIGLSETVAAYNRGWLDAYEEAGHGLLVQVSDGDGDPACRQANRKLWTVDYARAHTLQHPNCKRRFGPPKQAVEPKALVPLVRTLDKVV